MIGRTNAGSGTGGLLINVVGGLSQPENPTYVTVWLETEVPINGWEILSVAPDWEAAEGHVYLQDAPSTSVDTPNFAVIDAAKKPYGAIWERLIGAFQRINGEWVRLNGAMWRDGVWTPFFGATINITYPAGSTCTATDGVTTLIAPDTTGVWACVVPNAGTWTVSLNNRFHEVVSITDNGQIVTIDKWYLYKNGNEYNGLTGGWQGRGWPTSSDFTSKAPTIVKTDNYIKAKKESGVESSGVLETVNDIDMNGFKTLNIDLLYEKSGSAAWVRILLSTNRNSQYALDNMCSSLDLEDSDANVRKTVSLDISAINTDVDVCINLRGQSTPTSQITMYNMWLE